MREGFTRDEKEKGKGKDKCNIVSVLCTLALYLSYLTKEKVRTKSSRRSEDVEKGKEVGKSHSVKFH